LIIDHGYLEFHYVHIDLDMDPNKVAAHDILGLVLYLIPLIFSCFDSHIFIIWIYIFSAKRGSI